MCLEALLGSVCNDIPGAVETQHEASGPRALAVCRAIAGTGKNTAGISSAHSCSASMEHSLDDCPQYHPGKS